MHGTHKALSEPFLCIIKLEAKFFQCVAVRISSGYLSFESRM
jgi:hypothetical protein